MHYVGEDGHKDICVFTVENASGKVIETFETPATSEGMDILIEKMGGKKFKVLAESSTYTINLHEYLSSKGVESYLAHPTKLKLITESNKKTDRNDSKTLADYLRLWDKGELDLSISYIVKDKERDLREMCRLREDMAQMKGQTMQKIKSHMRVNSQYCVFTYLSTKKAREWIRTNLSTDLTLMMLLDLYAHYETVADSIDREIRKDYADREDVKLLQSIPGIGLTTAAELSSMIVNVKRFPTADKMRSYFGMCPKVKNSGQSVKHGHITKCGDPMMRQVLGRTIASHIKNAPGDSIARYKASHKGHGRSGTLNVACMNKLLDLAYAILTRGTPYVSR